MAEAEHLQRLLSSVFVWNLWRQKHPEIYPELIGADLSGADLSGADLSRTDLSMTYLSHANLSSTNLDRTDLSGADLSKADLSKANLNWANLNSTNLTGTNFTNTRFSNTIFVHVDLDLVKGLETAIHLRPSAVDINSVILPPDEDTRLHFLRGVGFTETQIEYLPSLLTPRPIQYHSLFISYAHQDETLARCLHKDLQDNGVRCWFAPHDLKIGEKLRPRIDESIHLHDKLLLLLSEHSVSSQWVEHEVETALGKEREGKPNVLFPLGLDDTVVKSTTGWASHIRLTRHIGDFTNWQDDAAYQKAFTRLLRDLKVDRSPMK